MEQAKGATASRMGKHLNYPEHILIEKLLTDGLMKEERIKGILDADTAGPLLP